MSTRKMSKKSITGHGQASKLARRQKVARLLAVGVGAFGTLLAGHKASAADVNYYWNVAGNFSGNGTWDTVTSNWNSPNINSAATTWVNGTTSEAVFGNAGGAWGNSTQTIGNGTAISLNEIYFTSSTLGATDAINSGNATATLNFVGTSPTIDVGNGSLSNVVAINAVIASGNLTKVDTGMLVLAGNNTYAGTTTVSAGTLDLQNSLALQNSTLTAPTAGNVTFDSAVSSHAFTLGGLSGSGNLTLTDIGNNPVALTVGNNNTNTTYTGVVSGTGSLTKVGTGNLTLGTNATADTYSGGVNVLSGMVFLLSNTGTAPVLGTGPVTLGAGSGNASAGMQINNGSSETYNNPISVMSGGTGTLSLLAGTNGSQYFTNVFMHNSLTLGGSTASININNLTTYSEPDVLTVTTGGAKFFGGTLLYTGGTYIIGNATLSTSNSNLSLGTGTVTFGNSTSNGTLGVAGETVTVSGLAVGTGATPASQTITDNSSNAGYLVFQNGNSTFGGIILDGTKSVALTVNSGSLTLTGNNTYSGGTTINGGFLGLSGSGTLGNASGKSLTLGGGTLDLGNGTVPVSTLTISAAPASGNTIQNGNLTATAFTTSLNSGTAVITANLSLGTSAISLSGPATLTLSGNTSYTGATSINGSMLNIGGITASASTGALTIGGTAGGGVLNYTTTGSVTQSFTGTTISGGASAILTNNGNFSLTMGAITRSAAGDTVDFTLPNGGTGSFTTSSTTLAANGILVSAASNGTAFATANGGTAWATNTSGTIGAMATGSTGNSSYTTPTNNIDVSNGDAPASTFTVNTLRFNAGNETLTLPTGTNIINTGGILVTPGTNGNITGAGTITGNATGKELVVFDYGTLNIGSIVSNTNTPALTLSGNGTTTLSAANAYTGTTTINSGTLAISGSGKLGTGALKLYGGALNLGGTSQTVGAITIADPQASGTIAIQSGNLTGTASLSTTFLAGNATITANLNLGNGTITQGNGVTTTGTLILSGNNTYTGGTTVSHGNLLVTNSAALGSGNVSVTYGNLELQGNNMTFPMAMPGFNSNGLGIDSLENISGNNTCSGFINATNKLTIGSDAGMLALTNTGTYNAPNGLQLQGNGNGSFAENLSMATGALNKAGNGTWTVSGNNTMTLGSGSIVVNAGTLILTGSNTTSNATLLNAGTLQLGTGGSIGNSSVTVSPGTTFIANAGTSVSSGNTATTFTLSGSGLVAPTLSLVDGAIGNVTIGGNLSLAGIAGLVAPALKFDIGNASTDQILVHGLTFGAGASTIALSPIAGTTSLAAGNYTLISDATTTNNPTDWTLASGNITVGGKLYNLSLANSTSMAEILTTSYGGPPTWTGAGNNSWDTASPNWMTSSGSVYSDGMNVVFDDTGNNTNPVNITAGGVNPAAVTFNNSANTYAFTGGQIGGAATLTLNGNGTVILLNGNNTYTGNTTINAGTLQLGNGTSGFDAAIAGNITNNAAVAFNLYGNQTYAGAISGNGTVTVAGNPTSVLTLSGNNTYSGGTTVNAGTLALANTTGSATGTGSVTINSGGILGGSGTMAPTGTTGTLIAIASGASLAPSFGVGNSTATLHANVSSSASAAAFNIAGGATLNYNFGAPGTSDLLAVTGNVTLAAGNDTLNINQLTGFGAGNYTLISAGSLTDNVGNWTLPTSTQYVYAVVGNSTALVLDVTPSGPVTLIWNGANTASWDTTSNNWLGSAHYVDGDLVVFADILLGNFTVDLGGVTFYPGAVTVNNSNSAYSIGDGTIGGNASLTKNGTNTLTLTGNNTYSGGTTVNAGTLDVATATNGLLAGGNVTNYAALQFDGSQSLGTISGNGTTTVSGTGSLTVGSISQASLVNNGAMMVNGIGTVATLSDTSGLGSAGNTTISSTGNLTVTSFAQASLINNGITSIIGTGTIGQLSGTGSLNIGNGSLANTVTLAAAATPGVLGGVKPTQGLVTIASGSTLDITNNALLLNYGNGTSPLAAVANAVAYGAGKAGNASSNGAIISSTVNTSAAGKYAVGYADHTEISSIPTGNVEVAYTLAGDANLDGSVDILDYQQMAPHYDEAGTYDWSQGDFNHDGHVDILDYQAMAPNYDTKLTAGTLIGADSLTALTSLTAADLAKPIGAAVAAAELQTVGGETADGITATNITAAIPEPASLSLLLLGGIPLLGRRRRKVRQQ